MRRVSMRFSFVLVAIVAVLAPAADVAAQAAEPQNLSLIHI